MEPLFGETPRADANLKPTKYAQVIGVPSAISPPVPGRILMLLAETQAIRIRDDGTDPTTAVGFLIPAGVAYEYKGDTRNLRIIEAAASATLNVLGYD